MIKSYQFKTLSLTVYILMTVFVWVSHSMADFYQNLAISFIAVASMIYFVRGITLMLMAEALDDSTIRAIATDYREYDELKDPRYIFWMYVCHALLIVATMSHLVYGIGLMYLFSLVWNKVGFGQLSKKLKEHEL